MKLEPVNADVKVFSFTTEMVTLAKNAVGGQGEVGDPEEVAASPTKLSFACIVCSSISVNRTGLLWIG